MGRPRRPTRTVADPPPARERLTAAARKRSILAGARRAFSENGDLGNTTIKIIAEYSGVSEGVIYKHFETKEELFAQAVVEPLKQTIDELVAAAAVVDQDEPLTPSRQLETTGGLYQQLIAALKPVIPLLGLVLFGEAKLAQRFYRDTFAVAMDRLAEAWSQVEDRHEVPFESADIAARAVLGIALIMALESKYAKGVDRARALTLISEGTVHGFFPANSSVRWTPKTLVDTPED